MFNTFGSNCDGHQSNTIQIRHQVDEVYIIHLAFISPSRSIYCYSQIDLRSGGNQ